MARGGGTPWATSDQEALDEVQDADILKAVVTSMEEWHKRHKSHRQKRAESSVCYPDVGCFQDSGPFSYLDMLPSAPEEVSTRFFLFSGRARANSPIMDVPFTNMSTIWSTASKAFNVSAPTKIIVHGFGGSCGHVWVYEMRSALMTVEDCNLICVDWEAGAVIPNYVRAAANTRLVGKQLSMLLDGLRKHVGLPIENMHVIGFSLGAHVAGFAGAELKNLSRITGLDPAAPLFESQDPRARLDSTDAMFVDVIHSNGENLILGGLGSWQPMGHVDFYPNGGRMQKGCSNLFVGAVSDILWSASDVEGRSLCNHRRAYKFFTDSVSPRCHFPSFPCESYDKFLQGDCFPCNGDRQCGNMGYYADKSNGRGTLFLITREEEPFCAHQYHVRIDNSASTAPVTSYGKIELTLIGSSEINETLTLTQKDDEELKMGSSLARIAVPHPVLQEPKSVEIMYTAYSGWISSGLSTWSVDKVTLTDSFGKSMSVCKKDLVLESGTPVILPLYPGDCNPPQDNAVSTSDKEQKKPNKESLTLISSNNFTNFSFTPVFHIGDELLNSTAEDKADIPWQPIDFPDSSNTNTLDGTHNKRENARSFNSFLTNVVLHNSSTSERPEIKEPVLRSSTWYREVSDENGTSQTYSNEKPEISEPILSAKKVPVENTSSEVTTPRPSLVKPRDISRDENTKWIPAQELNPPPLARTGTQSWQQWVAGTNNTNPTKLNTTKEQEQEEGRRLSSSKIVKKSPHSSPMMIQFFPQRLASLLAQAEYYARLTLSFPISAMNKLMGNKSPHSDGDQETSASTNKLYTLNAQIFPETQRRPKQFTTARTTSGIQPRIDKIMQKNNVYVPYSYSNVDSDDKESVEISRFIPLSQYSLSHSVNYKYNTSQYRIPER